MSASLADRKLFINKLAKYLAGNSAAKSVAIEAERKTAEKLGALAKLVPQWGAEWAEVRSASNVRGWATEEEAERHLLQFFGLED